MDNDKLSFLEFMQCCGIKYSIPIILNGMVIAIFMKGSWESIVNGMLMGVSVTIMLALGVRIKRSNVWGHKLLSIGMFLATLVVGPLMIFFDVFK